MIRRLLITVFIGSVSTAFSFTSAQGVVRGKVFDSSTHQPLPGVYVTFGKNQGTSTLTDGSYSVRPGSGSTLLTFRFIGYKTATRTVELNPGDTVSLDVNLETDLTEIGHIVVSANRTEQKVAELTVSMDILKSSDFLDTHITDPQELVNKSSGIEVMDGQASIRGGTGFSYGAGSRVLVLIDGLPMISPDAGNIKWQFLPLENISQVEIIKGASSVLYGSSALNGVINFRTADAGNTPNTRFYAQAGIFGNPRDINWKWWNTPRIFSSLSFSHLQKYGNTDIGLGVNLLRNDGYRKYNDESLARFSLRLKHHDQKIRGLAYGMNINSGYTVKTDFVLWENATYGALKQDTSTVSLLHGTFVAIDPYISYKKRRFTHDLRTRFQLSDNHFPVREPNNSDAYSYYAEYQGRWIISDILSLTGGLTEDYARVNSRFYNDHTELNLAGFAQAELEPLPRVKLVAGMRVEQNTLDGKREKTVPIFRSGINWQAAEYTFIRASFGQGYRYPSIAEKFASTTLGTVKIFPNPYVKPESGWSAEAGVKQGILIGETKGQADLAIFMTQNVNMIEYLLGNYPDPVTGEYSYGFMATNIEFSRVYGSELQLSLTRKFGKISTSLSGGYTYLYPVEINQSTHKSTGEYLKYRRKHSALLGLKAVYSRFDIGVNLFAKSKILRIDDVFLNELTREAILPGFYDYWQTHNTGYFTMDADAGCRITRTLSISVAVKNLTNTEYMGRPGDIQPQRNYSLRLSGSF